MNSFNLKEEEEEEEEEKKKKSNSFKYVYIYNMCLKILTKARELSFLDIKFISMHIT